LTAGFAAIFDVAPDLPRTSRMVWRYPDEMRSSRRGRQRLPALQLCIRFYAGNHADQFRDSDRYLGISHVRANAKMHFQRMESLPRRIAEENGGWKIKRSETRRLHSEENWL
jgi:hypothetical protein